MKMRPVAILSISNISLALVRRNGRGGANGMQLQTQLGPLGAPGSFTEGGGTAKGNEAVKGGRRGCVCVYFEAEGLSALAGS